MAFNKRSVIYWHHDLADSARSHIMSDKGQMVISDVGFKGCVQISVGGSWFANKLGGDREIRFRPWCWVGARLRAEGKSYG